MKSKTPVITGILGWLVGGIGWVLTRDYSGRTTTNFQAGSAGDKAAKGVVGGLAKIISVPFAIGGLLLVVITIILGLRALSSKDSSKTGAIIGVVFAIWAGYLSIAVFKTLK